MALEYIANTPMSIYTLVPSLPTTGVVFEAQYAFRKVLSVQPNGDFTGQEGASIIVMKDSTTSTVLKSFPLVGMTATRFNIKNKIRNSQITYKTNLTVLPGANARTLSSTYIGGDQFQVTWSNINVTSRLTDPATGISYTPNQISIYNVTTGSRNISYSGSNGTGVIGVPGPGSYSLEIAPAYYNPTGGPGGTPLLLVGPTQQTTIAVVPGDNPLTDGNSTQDAENPRVYNYSFTSTTSNSRTYNIKLVQPNTTTLVANLGSYTSTEGVTNHNQSVTIPSSVANGTYDIIIEDAITLETVRVAANIVVSGNGDVSAPVVNGFTASWEADVLTVAYTSITDAESGVYSALVTITSGAETVTLNDSIISVTSKGYAVLKNGKTYDVTFKVTNNAGLQTVETTQVVVPAGYGAAGYGRGGYGR